MRNVSKETLGLVCITSPRWPDIRPLNYFWYHCRTHAINKLRYVFWYGVVITPHTTFDHFPIRNW